MTVMTDYARKILERSVSKGKKKEILSSFSVIFKKTRQLSPLVK